jgi:DNA repair protein RecN (Recombination protein N)
VLHELRVQNLLLIDRAELALAPGLNVLTGETGAGKTLLAHALDLLLGGKARSGMVGGTAAEAYVEGVFSLPERSSGEATGPATTELIPEDADEITLARRVWPDGRTRAYVCGRAASVADLRELGAELLAFYGQHEHRKLMLSSAPLELLDAHCGSQQLAVRARLAAVYRQTRRLEAQVAELCELAAARERELDLVAFELGEIEAAAASEQEAQALASERDRLRHAEALRTAAAGAAQSVSPEAGEGACDLLAVAAQHLQSFADIDPDVNVLRERLHALRYEAEDVGRELRSYAMASEASPGQLEQLEERLEQFARLMRKHGGSIADVLAHAERCRRRQQELQNADLALESASRELAELRGQLEQLAIELRERRLGAAPGLAAAVRERLRELAMAEASFEVEVIPRADCGPHGADAVDLLIAPNPGVPPAPLREIASGGELSRVMLALLSVAHETAEPSRSAPLLVFDEIDAGIGGHTARAVGEHLRKISQQGRQVLCITHLPQIAALASRHFTIAKDATTTPPRTVVTSLDGDGVVGELVRMLGAAEGDSAASKHARQLLRAA